MQLFCIYCGKARDLWCRDCKENHLVDGREYWAYWGENAEDDDEVYERVDAAPDYRTAEQYHADKAHDAKRKYMTTGE